MERNLELADKLRRTVAGPLWHGDALHALLHGVTAADAAAHSVAGAHSIWELVLHMTAWARIARTRLSWHAQPEPTAAEDWPAVGHADSDDARNSAWRDAQAALGRAYNELADAARDLTDEQLDHGVPGRAYPVRDMLAGVVEHGAYHGGQIGLLKRALAAT